MNTGPGEYVAQEKSLACSHIGITGHLQITCICGGEYVSRYMYSDLSLAGYNLYVPVPPVDY